MIYDIQEGQEDVSPEQVIITRIMVCKKLSN